MGIRVTIGNQIFEAENYSVIEDSTPTSSDDSTGSVGTFSFDFVNIKNPLLLQGEEVSLTDSRKGTTVGFVTQITERDNGLTNIQCQSRLGRLNIYGVQAQPYSGDLKGAFEYYLQLAGQTTDILVDDSIENLQVAFPGWKGELWYNLKQLASANNCEVSLVSNIILLRPLRTRVAVDDRNVARSRSYGGASLAKAVEVYVYNNKPITDKLVYPPNGWTPETEIITVNAGEEVERVIQLGASISSFQDPVMVTSVSQTYDSSSVYTVVGDDGLPIEPSQWVSAGGRVTFSVEPDTVSMKVVFRGATNIRSIKNQPISTFSLALGADFTGNRYSTLRIVGTGVKFNKELITVRTLIPDELTGTDVGVTIDNPFISTHGQAYTAGVRAAKWFAGEKLTITGEVTNVNRRGDSGVVLYPKYELDQDNHSGDTYLQVEQGYAGRTYRSVQDEYADLVKDEFDNQLFGNTGGARVWDRHTLRWYRIRSGTVNPGTVTFDAEDDLVYNDLAELYVGSSYGEVENYFVGDSYSVRDRRGLFVKDFSGLPESAFPFVDHFPGDNVFPQGVVV